MSSNPEDLARTVAALRAHLGMTQIDFAQHLGVGLSTVIRAESLKRGPAMDSMRALAEAATKAGRKDLADVFVRAFRDEYGPVLTMGALGEKGSSKEEHYVSLLRDVFRNAPEFAKSLTTLLDVWEERRGKKR